MARRKASQGRPKPGSLPSLLEWVAGIVGLVVAAAIIVFIARDAFGDGVDKPPLLQVRPTGINSDGGLHMVEVTVVNRSGQTAADVEILGELARDGTLVESGSATLSYVPGHSMRKAGLVFRNDPRRFALTVRPGGYELP